MTCPAFLIGRCWNVYTMFASFQKKGIRLDTTLHFRKLNCSSHFHKNLSQHIKEVKTTLKSLHLPISRERFLMFAPQRAFKVSHGTNIALRHCCYTHFGENSQLFVQEYFCFHLVQCLNLLKKIKLKFAMLLC